MGMGGTITSLLTTSFLRTKICPLSLCRWRVHALYCEDRALERTCSQDTQSETCTTSNMGCLWAKAFCIRHWFSTCPSFHHTDRVHRFACFLRRSAQHYLHETIGKGANNLSPGYKGGAVLFESHASLYSCLRQLNLWRHYPMVRITLKAYCHGSSDRAHSHVQCRHLWSLSAEDGSYFNLCIHREARSWGQVSLPSNHNHKRHFSSCKKGFRSEVVGNTEM